MTVRVPPTEQCKFCSKRRYAYDDFYGWLCFSHLQEKVTKAKINPWTGKPR